MTKHILLLIIISATTFAACKKEKSKKQSSAKGPTLYPASSADIFQSWDGKSSVTVDLTKEAVEEFSQLLEPESM